jgi:hypothetical protein
MELPYVLIDTDIIALGLVGDMGPKRWATLSTIASFMDENGVAIVTHEEIAKAMGITVSSAGRWVRSLARYRWNGKPIVNVKKVRSPSNAIWLWTEYSILLDGRMAIKNYRENNETRHVMHQSKCGLVYFIREHMMGTVKIGITTNLKGRSRQFGVQLPFDWDYIKIVKSNNYIDLEQILHQNLLDHHVHGEWFKLTDEEIDDALSDSGIDYYDVTSEELQRIGVVQNV